MVQSEGPVSSSTRDTSVTLRLLRIESTLRPAMQSITFSLAYEANFSKTVRLLRSRGIRGEAEEIAQAAWVQAWERLSQLRHADALPIWVNSIALNIFRTNHRWQERFQDTNREPSCLPVNGIAALDAAKLLHTCSDSDRHMLEQHYVQGYNVREIADQFGCSHVALRLRLMRAKRKITAARLPTAAPVCRRARAPRQRGL